MNKFWKWFFIILGILAIAGAAFCVTLFFLRGGTNLATYGPRGYAYPGGMMGRGSLYGGMMFGMGFMLLRGLFGLAVLVLAGFGVASLVRRSKAAVLPAVPTTTCANCGKPLAADWKACPHCGAVISAEAVPVTEEPQKKTKAKTS